ncbi:MAG: tRNA (N(6)-L-threonylcarbamoyladenosine(37)-C(2))-methylthiotransferase [Candidatus Heimdallarchaeota archaeon]|nr:tRNA (N(6)-L-threonylcarbamoyladenosine(37)-C(2))-methylthiotransferase [Candidatus Heimdallarchaeota archaeon]
MNFHLEFDGTMVNFHVKTYGCTANLAASELMVYLLKACGYNPTKSIDDADFVIVNTCIVKAPTENKVKYQLRKLYEKYPLIVVGCLPQVLTSWCREKLPKAALVGVDNYEKICQAANALLQDTPLQLLNRRVAFSSTTQRIRDRKLTGIIVLSKGCTGQCTYCIVKLAKGPLVSKSAELILQEARTALKNGCKELWLTAQDTASYGIDLSSSLPEIVSQIVHLPEDFMVRVGMMNPNYALKILPNLKEMFAHPKVYAFIHVPVQSGSNKVLAMMKRKYTIEDYEYLVTELREALPALTLSTDIISGFPGESAQDHQQTKELIYRLQPDIVNLSKYGDRPGTKASKSTKKIPSEIIKARSKELTRIIQNIAFKRNKEWIDWEGSVLVLRREKHNQAVLARNKSYKLIQINNASLKMGENYPVKILDATKTRLLGKLL